MARPEGSVGARRNWIACAAITLVVGTLTGCSPPVTDAPEAPVPAAAHPTSQIMGPRLVALGTVQDGGLPHAACSCTRCTTARNDPAARRYVASLALHLPDEDLVFLVDATPDLREQLQQIAALRGRVSDRVDRAPVDGVLLTHAHIGHYLGLAFFGFEAIHTRALAVYGTPAMLDLLRTNAPWSQLVRLENILPRELTLGEPVTLSNRITVTALPAPHRNEFADTVGFVFRGPRAAVLYVPDTDAWRAWNPPLTELLRDVDIAILDGTFFSMDELPGRRVASIGHPTITETMDLLEETVRDGRLRVYFTHFNHSNPVLEATSAARDQVERRGFHLLDEGDAFEL
jgi:pyrroloquinoline quinone biosynthesis protein B